MPFDMLPLTYRITFTSTDGAGHLGEYLDLDAAIAAADRLQAMADALPFGNRLRYSYTVWSLAGDQRVHRTTPAPLPPANA
jgi:hypothetical protein